MEMDLNQWTPSENTLILIKQLLQDALIPNSEIQRNVQLKLKEFESNQDFIYYLLYIIGQTSYPEDIRALSAILLKNNLLNHYNKLTNDCILSIRQLCLLLLNDQCRDVRTNISNVIVNLAKDNLNNWPELIPYLIEKYETTIRNEYRDIIITTIFNICEELMNLEKTEDEICSITTNIFTKFVDYLIDDKFNKKENIIKLINQFLQDYYKIMKQSLDLTKYLRYVIQLANNSNNNKSDDGDIEKYICHTFVIYIENREECLLPHLHDIIGYLLTKTQQENLEIALNACEFWLATTKLNNCKDILLPYIDKLIPILLKNMKYSEYELIALKDIQKNDIEIENQQTNKSTIPFHLHTNNCKNNDDFDFDDCSSSNGVVDDDDVDGVGYLTNNDDVDDFYIGWTLRKCSAATLDALSLKFGDDLLPIIIPYLNELLYHQDYLIKESGILALGAISEGCMNGLKPHLHYLIQYLINVMNSDNNPIIRVITCWTLSRYINWIIYNDDENDTNDNTYFLTIMTILLKNFHDNNKRVQRAALSAFCVFQEEAKIKLIPYINLILDSFQIGFEKFHYRSLYLLYDAINVLAHSVGNELNRNEYIDKLIPPLIQKLNEYNSYTDDQFIAVLECLTNIIPYINSGILPFAEMLYTQCMEIIIDIFMIDLEYEKNYYNSDDYEPPDKEAMHVALDCLCSLALALKNYFYKFVINSNLICLLYTTMQDSSYLIRQTSIALYGELVLICYPYLSNNIGDCIKIITKNLDQNYEGVCKNAAWTINKICTVIGNDIKPFIPDILNQIILILKNPIVSRPIYQTIAITLCTLCCICPDIYITITTTTITSNDIDNILKICCISVRTLRDSDDKDLAFRGLCNLIIKYPEFCQSNFIYFCDAVASWNQIKPDLKQIIRNILLTIKEQYGEANWLQFSGQFPDLLKMQLYNLYGIV